MIICCCCCFLRTLVRCIVLTMKQKITKYDEVHLNTPRRWRESPCFLLTPFQWRRLALKPAPVHMSIRRRARPCGAVRAHAAPCAPYVAPCAPMCLNLRPCASMHAHASFSTTVKTVQVSKIKVTKLGLGYTNLSNLESPARGTKRPRNETSTVYREQNVLGTKSP